MANIAVTLKTGTNPHQIDRDHFKKWPLGDFGTSSVMNFTIQDSGGTAINLTGITPKLTFYEPSPFGLRQVFQKDTTIVVAASGTCKYQPIEGEFQKRSIMFGRVELDTGTTIQESTQEFVLEVL